MQYGWIQLAPLGCFLTLPTFVRLHGVDMSSGEIPVCPPCPRYRIRMIGCRRLLPRSVALRTAAMGVVLLLSVIFSCHAYPWPCCGKKSAPGRVCPMAGRVMASGMSSQFSSGPRNRDLLTCSVVDRLLRKAF
jgi:hypothetical protein